MNKSEKDKSENAGLSTQPGKFKWSDIFALMNRGMLLDIFVFLINLILMRWLVSLFLNLVKQAEGGDFFSELVVFGFFLAMFILPPLGSMLKRWHFQQRMKLAGISSTANESSTSGCLFNPIIYFCLNITIYCALLAFVMQYLYGDNKNGGVFISSIFFGIALTGFQTYLVYRYFSAPKNPPRTDFMRGTGSERIGDIFIFLNMILYQILWNLLAGVATVRRSSDNSIPAEIFYRFLFIFSVSLFVYFPPRIFYLAEDIHRRRVWLTILLANLPLILRVLYGAF